MTPQIIPRRVAAMLEPNLKETLDDEFNWLMARCGVLGIHFTVDGNIVCNDLDDGYTRMNKNHVRCILKHDYKQQRGQDVPAKHLDIFFDVMHLNIKKCYEDPDGKQYFVRSSVQEKPI
jgi:hypothetical protein